METENNKMVLNKQTLLPVGIVLVIISAIFYLSTFMAQIQTNQQAMQVDIGEIRDDYVPRAEYTATMANINQSLGEIKTLLNNI